MIRRLRRRMTLMVIAVLILVSSGIVLAISLANSHSIAAQAEETLAVLTENAGAGENRIQRPDGIMDPRGGRMNRDRRGFRGEPPEIRSSRDAAAAGLNNSYTIFSPVNGNAYFTDAYAKTFAFEDRARIFEKMFLASGEEPDKNALRAFSYQGIINKGKYLCELLRNNFLTVLNADEVYWEKAINK